MASASFNRERRGKKMTTFTLRNADVKKNYENFYRGLPDHKTWQITIREFKKDLTAQQRNFFHQCVRVISEFNGDEPEDIKMRLKYACLPLRSIVVGDKTYMVPISTESLDRTQYSKLIDAALMLGSSLGLTMPSPSIQGLEI
jgi:hypothetical protein